MTYDDLFMRLETPSYRRRTIDEFDGLLREGLPFASDQGQLVAGYKYWKEGRAPKGTVIICPGLGLGGHCCYMDVADYFTTHDYLVFAYDSTGTDESDGDSIVGMQQGIIDLSFAIDRIERDPEMGSLPIMLFGHSWGAFCADAVLSLHPEVRAVVSIAGFNDTYGWFESVLGGEEVTLLDEVTPTERSRFGDYARLTALDGLASTSAQVMVIQSKDDRNVQESVGYDLFFDRFGDDDRFAFRLYENRGHLFIFYTQKAREYDCMFFCEDDDQLTEYGRGHVFDKSVGYELDQDFFADILAFYDSSQLSRLGDVS